MWLYPRPTPEEIREVYQEHYYSNRDFLSGDSFHLYGYSDYIYERINKQYSYKLMVRKVRELMGSRPDVRPRWLDVGCGLGYMMDVAFDEGFEAIGLEFNPAAVEYIRSKYRFTVQCGTISDLDTNETYDVISMLDVIEHLSDPFEDLRKLRKLARDDAFLLVSTMDSDSFTSRLLGTRLEDFRRTREHLYFFSRKSLRACLCECGWEVLREESIGHTFQLSFLIDRIGLMLPRVSKVLRAVVFPRWLLDANLYLNPRTKMLVFARPRPGIESEVRGE